MDDNYLGGMRSGGKRGCGAAGKTPFVAAVSTSPEGRPRKVKAGGNQGLPQAQIRARRQAFTHPWNGSCLSLPFIPSIAETLEFCITTGYPFRHA